MNITSLQDFTKLPNKGTSKYDLQAVGGNFEIPGRFVSAVPYGSGHINDTYAATYDAGRGNFRYIHQRINHNIFKDPVALMENIARVTDHQRDKLQSEGSADLERRALTTIRSRDGRPYYRDADGDTWRTYIFIEGATSHDSIKSPLQAREAAKAFGQFQSMLTNLPGERLHDTIPDFHHTPKRLDALETAIRLNPKNRAKEVAAEIDFVLRRAELTSVLLCKHQAGQIPERITHNDTKLNNVMLDNSSSEGICVIDLDTVMPGLVLYDFGDMVRTATSPRAEDEQDLSSIYMQMPMFEALVDGYLTSAHHFLTPTERDFLAFSGKLITLEIGIRFLTDYLLGDSYFKIKREHHNLDRCRTQLRLVASIEEQEAAMNEVVRAWAPQ
ncbi:MAG TPA: aminoglycoside phosphotransferase family protein [Chthoniobacteraceae bacterium]|jgi:hypothetical protein|nr:aminoglycoside phosphotransferase family protein [Chthoniobacteraceae bacterium]